LLALINEPIFDQGRTALHVAVQAGNEPLVSLLLQSSASCNALADGDIGTPLHIAVEKQQRALAQLLLANGSRVNMLSKSSGDTPLHLASYHGDCTTIQLLLDNAAKVNRVSRQRLAPIHSAAIFGHTDAMRLLLSSSASANMPDRKSVSPLAWACTRGYNDVAELLLEFKADVHVADGVTSQTALVRACMTGNAALVRLLLENQASVDTWDKYGSSAMQWACSFKEPTATVPAQAATTATATTTSPNCTCIAASEASVVVVVAPLAEHQTADSSIRATDSPRTVPIYAQPTVEERQLGKQQQQQERLEILQLLLDAKGTVDNERYAEMGSPLYHACARGYLDIARFLLEHGADPSFGQVSLTPIAAALSNRNIALTELLLSHNAAVSAASILAIPRPARMFLIYLFEEWVCKFDRNDLLPAIMRHADFSLAMRFRGYTPLGHALLHGNVHAASVLLDAGAANRDDTSITARVFECENDELIAKYLGLLVVNRELDLSNLKLATIAPLVARCIVQMPRIKLINLAHNDLDTIPTILAEASHLDVNLAGNPLELVPESYRASWSKMRPYLLSVRSRTVLWREHKLIIVGDAGSGKTTLAACCKQKKNKVNCSTNLSTNGISITQAVSMNAGKRQQHSKDKPSVGSAKEMSSLLSSPPSAASAVAATTGTISASSSPANGPIGTTSTTNITTQSSTSNTHNITTASSAAAASYYNTSTLSPSSPMVNALPSSTQSSSANSSELAGVSQTMTPLFHIWDFGGQEVFYPTHQVSQCHSLLLVTGLIAW
jgi:ankyrin repeat protein/GTPase SAR1 family protein